MPFSLSIRIPVADETNSFASEPIHTAAECLKRLIRRRVVCVADLAADAFCDQAVNTCVRALFDKATDQSSSPKPLTNGILQPVLHELHQC